MALAKTDDTLRQCESCLYCEFLMEKTVSLLHLQEQAKPSWHQDSLSNNIYLVKFLHS